ncbi:MAG: sialidase family protein [Gaiellaceae bacterium]
MTPGRLLVALAAALSALAVAIAGAAAPGPAPSFTAPAQLGFPEGDDWEPSIATDRFGHVYAFWNHYGFDPSCPSCPSPHMVLQISSDGGNTWGPPRAHAPDAAAEQHDPQIVVDPVDGKTVYTGFMIGSKSSMFVAKSTDFGQTWKRTLVEQLEKGTDKDILAVRGDYIVLVYNAVMKIFASVSHDGGVTWTTVNVAPQTTSKLGWSLPSGGAIDSKGNAYFAWAGYEGNGKPSGDVNLFVTKSTDGGATWTTKVVDVSGAPRDCDCGGWAYWGAQIALAVDAKDRVFVLYNASDEKFGITRMYFRRSTDGGATWTARKDISLAPVGSNNLFPAIVARGNGDVRIAWQDDRNGFDAGGDDLSARWNTYYRTSTDGGRNWSAEAQVSQFESGYSYKFADGYLEPYGDYFELDIDAAGKTHALWGEGPSYAGPGNVWYARGL